MLSRRVGAVFVPDIFTGRKMLSFVFGIETLGTVALFKKAV